MHTRHFVAAPLCTGDGYTYTLTTRLGHMLHEVESCYGSRDKDWTILGVEFGQDVPQLWYPGNRRHVAIQLAQNAIESELLACYQLAHETVHLLAPGGRPPAPVIEEGLATVFSEDYVAREFGASSLTNMAAYVRAATLVRQLLAIDPQAIIKLRAVEPAFRLFNADSFSYAAIEAPAELIEALLRPFDRK
jgi:hypothetical protein